jgi:hypothetical protein
MGKDKPASLSPRDLQALARLVERYGADAVIAAVPVARKRSRGRPSRGRLPRYEAIHFTQWIEDRIEEHREAGETAPVKLAYLDAFEMKYGVQAPEDFETFYKRMKRYVTDGRRDLEFIRRNK